MCSWCRHGKEFASIVDDLKRRYPVPLTGAEKKAALQRMSEEIRQLKRKRKVELRSRQPTYLTDHLLQRLRFAAWVLNANREKNKGWQRGGWLNQNHIFA